MPDEIVDIQRACDELKIGKEIYLRIARRALDQTGNDIGSLRLAHQSSDIDQIKAIAHKLKGDYGNLRIDSLSCIARKLDALAKDNYDGESAAALIEEFVMIADQITKFLHEQD